MEGQAFLDRVFARLKTAQRNGYHFDHWSFGGKPTDEGIGVLAMPGVDAEKLIARVMDVDHYRGNIDHVLESRSVKDARFTPPQQVRFYQRIDIPLLSELHQELVLVDGGTRDGWRYAWWYLLDKETEILSPKVAARSGYNFGGWFVAPGVVAYALSSAPRKEDLGFLKWKALTTGADAAASKVVRANIEGMSRWASRG